MMISSIFLRLSIAIILFNGVWSRCTVEVLSPDRITLQLEYRDYVMETCRFRSKCDAEVGFYRVESYDSTKLTSILNYDWLSKGLFYQQYCRHYQVGDWTYYDCQMIINSLSDKHASHYYCHIHDKNDKTVKASRHIFFLTIQSHTSPPTTECFLPSAQNITVKSALHHDGSVNVTLVWNVSVKEGNNNYCTGSRRWRVLTRSFDDVAKTPDDGSSKFYSHGWINVPSRDTQFTFSQLLNNRTYYQFLVGNRPDRVSQGKVRTFGSNIYYFGKQSAPVIKQSQQLNTVKMGQYESLELPCTATGTPSPNVWWISTNQHGVSQTFGKSSSTLLLNDVTMAHKGTYFCIASNVVVNPPDGKRANHRVWEVTVDVKDYNTSFSGLTCSTNLISPEFYCKDYLHSQFSIYSNVSITKNSREAKVGTAMTNIYQYIKDERCRAFAESLLCHTVYPYCDVHQSMIPIPRPICNSACIEFSNGICKSYSNFLKEQNPTLYGFITSKCEVSAGGKAPECIPITYESSKKDETRLVLDTGSCVRGNGIGYSGNQVYTKSKNLCQLWIQQSPHKHPMLPTIYASELQGAGYSCRNPGGLGIQPWCYTTNSNVRWEYCDIPQCDTCEVYNGMTCSNVSGYNNGKVFVRRGKNINGWEDIEKEISQVSLKARYHQRPSIGCQQLLEILLCHIALPLCDGNISRSLCSDHCKVLSTMKEFCSGAYNEYMSFISNNPNSTFLSDLECNSSCLSPNKLHVPELSKKNAIPANKTFSCYSDKGTFYQGNVSVTDNGFNCLKWHQSHSSFIIDTIHYPELVNASNYCRNPGELLDRPWCLTNSIKGWDYCAIDFCLPAPNTFNPYGIPLKNNGKDFIQAGQSPAFLALSTTFSVIFAIFLIAIIIVGIVAALIRKRRQKMKKKNSPEQGHVLKEDKFVVNSNYLQSTTINNVSVIPANFKMLDSKQIKYVSQLGQGNFGIVFKGQAYNISADEEETEVAVKSLKEESSSEVVSNFIDEAKLMFTFNHPNILQIYGVCMSEMPYQMVLEYMDGGDLTQFLRARASSTQRRIVNPFSYRSRTESSYSNDPPSLSKTQLLFICTQIADGMKYLASENHVHRDLACRNCLIKSDLTVKIADFGMSRNLYSRDYYRVKGQAILPVRWMPPEALVYGTFSVEGDVWSFGVVMWEVFSFALQPYYGRTNEEVTEAIRHGKILNRPDDCPTETYELMKECWNMEPKARPTFDELYSELSQLHHCSEVDYKSESDNYSYNSDDSDAFFSEENNSLPEGIVLT